MIKLNVAELAVSSFSPAPGGGLGDDETMLKNTDPRACPYTQGWNCAVDTQYDCYTNADGCQSGGGAGC